MAFAAPAAALLLALLLVTEFEAAFEAAAAEWATALSKSELGLPAKVEDADDEEMMVGLAAEERTEWLGELTVTPERDNW